MDTSHNILHTLQKRNLEQQLNMDGTGEAMKKAAGRTDGDDWFNKAIDKQNNDAKACLTKS